MGFGSVAASILLFIGVVVVASTFIVYMNNYAQEASSTLNTQKDQILEEISTTFTITESSVNTSANPDEIYLYARNTGSTRVQLEYIDVFVAGSRIPTTDRTITVEADTDLGNSLLWDPQEVIFINASRTITGLTRVRVVTDSGASDEVLVSS